VFACDLADLTAGGIPAVAFLEPCKSALTNRAGLRAALWVGNSHKSAGACFVGIDGAVLLFQKMDREPETRKNGVARKGLSGPHVPLFFSENGSRKTMPEAYLPLAPLPIDNFYILNT
jgi:hypothetical protein